MTDDAKAVPVDEGVDADELRRRIRERRERILDALGIGREPAGGHDGRDGE